MATLTVYPSIDGFIQEAGVTMTWAQIIAAAGNVANTATDPFFCSLHQKGVGSYTNSNRGGFIFDTSALTAGVTVSAATLSLYASSMVDTSAVAWTFNIYGFTPASDAAFVGADYAQVGSTAFCDTAISDATWAGLGYQNFAYNATGLASISLTGNTRVCIREAAHEVAASDPLMGDSTVMGAGCNASEQAGTTKDPVLVVTYTAASPAGSAFGGIGWW